MGIVQGPAMSLAASGNIGAINYTTWRGMAIARGAYSPSFTSTPAQITQQARITQCSQLWSADTSGPGRDLWNIAAKTQVWKNRFGDPWIPLGYHYFMKVNMLRRSLGQSATMSIPEPREPVDVGVFDIDDYSVWTYVRIVFAKSRYVKTDADGFQIWTAGPFDSGGYTAQEKDFRHLINWTALAYYNGWHPTAGKWYTVRCRYYFKDGVVGNWFEEKFQKIVPI